MSVTVGLDIGTTAVRAAVVDSRKSKLVLRRYAEMPIPVGAVEAGEIVEEDVVAEAVAALWKRAKLPTKRVVLGTANQRVIVRPVDVPQMDEDELSSALGFQVQDAIPMPVEEARLDYVTLDEFVTPEGEPMIAILVVAAHEEVVEGLLRVASAASLSPIAVDLQPFAIARSSSGPDAIDDATHGVVDIGGTITQIVFVRGGIVRFVRMLPMGGHSFTTALANALEMSEEEAENLKKSVGVTPDESVPEDDGETAAAREVLTATADSLIEEIRGSINFYLAQNPEATLDRLAIAGNGARLPHLANRLGRATDLPIEPMKILSSIEVGRVDLSEGELLDAQPVLPTAVGLALWGSV